ncbi:MAG TPA: glycosyltransferase [Solirubrobacteraceae bacterium]|nr:glycosyltransferase [Solirubrobacteraceae bacterium]
MSPKASIIVPLAGGPVQALRCFQGIAAQAEDPAHEIIVVDGASVGLEPLLAQLAGDVEVVRNERRIGFATSARRGAEQARGEILVFLRDAAAPSPGWLAPLVAALGDPAVGVAASATGDGPGASQSPVAAWSFAVRAADFRNLELPDLPGPLVAGATALGLADRGLRAVTVPSSRVSAPGARTGGARRPAGEEPELTVVIPTLDAASERVRGCIAAVQATTDAAHEIVIIDNGYPPQGFTSPVNAGVRAARTPYVVVMNDDVEPLSGWWPPLRAELDAGAAVAFPDTIDGPMRFDFPAWCFAMTRESIGSFSHDDGEFFDPSLVLWYQDTDLLHRLREAGRPPVFVESARIRHGLSETVGSEDPELAAWIRIQVAADRERFISKHPDAALNGHVLAG